MAVKHLVSPEDWGRAFPVLQVLRPNLTLPNLLKFQFDLVQSGYQLAGIEIGSDLRCVAGFIIQPHLEFGWELWIHDLATLPTFQRQGHARELLAWLTELGKKRDCFRISVHTREHRVEAHSLYKAAGMDETARVFQRVLRKGGKTHRDTRLHRAFP